MARYSVEPGQREGEATLRLRDGETGASAAVWPGCGFNAFSLDLPSPSGTGEAVTVIQAPPALAEIRRRPSWWGVPLLFPFPGAIPDGEYTFGGRRYRLGRPEQPVVAEGHEAPGARRNFHGFVMDAPWTVTGTVGDDAGATAEATLDTADFPEMLEGFPFPFRLAATYRLDGGGLRLRFRAHNPGPGDLPCAFGAHPFFRLPLGPAGSPGECLVHIPAARRWEGRRLRESLRSEGKGGGEGNGEGKGKGEGEGEGGGGGEGAIPTEAEVRPPVPPELDLRTPRPFVEGVYNGLFTDLPRDRDGWIEASVIDPPNRRAVLLRASPGFENIVFWSPPGRPELCLEPWSSPSNVFNVAALGVPGHGLTVLAPGASATWEVAISLRAS